MLHVLGSVADRIEKAIAPFGYSVQNVSTHGLVSEHKLHISVTRKSWDQPAEIAAQAAVLAKFPFLMSEDGIHLFIKWKIDSDDEVTVPEAFVYIDDDLLFFYDDF